MVLNKKVVTFRAIGLFILIFLLHFEPTAAQSFDCSAQTYLDKNECNALVAIYDSTGGDTWGNLNKLWLGAANPCDESLGWFGVTCNTNTPANVTILSLPSNNLTGTLPPEIGDFQYMIELNLSGNGLLTGGLPGEIGTLVRLEILNIGVGGFTGNLPNQVGNLSFLKTLDISNNQFEGEIPSSFVNLTALTYFDTTNNTLCLPNNQNVQDWYDGITDTPGLLGPCETPTPTITPTKTKVPNTLTPTPIPLPTNTPTITPTPTITLTPTMLGPFQTLTALAYEDTLTATANWLKTPTPIMTATRYYILVSQTLVPAGEDQQVTQASAGQVSDSPIPGDEGGGRSPLWWLLLIIPVGLIGAGLFLEIRGRKSKKGDSGSSSNDDEGGFQTFI